MILLNRQRKRYNTTSDCSEQVLFNHRRFSSSNSPVDVPVPGDEQIQTKDEKKRNQERCHVSAPGFQFAKCDLWRGRSLWRDADAPADVTIISHHWTNWAWRRGGAVPPSFLRTAALLQSAPCTDGHTMKRTSYLCWRQEMGEGAISQSPVSKALRTFCQSRFPPSLFWLERLQSHDPPLPLPPRYGCSGRLLDWLDWLPSHPRILSERRCRPVFARGFSKKGSGPNLSSDWNLQTPGFTFQRSFFFFFFFGLVWVFFHQDLCTEKELTSDPVMIAFWLLPLQSTAFLRTATMRRTFTSK